MRLTIKELKLIIEKNLLNELTPDLIGTPGEGGDSLSSSITSQQMVDDKLPKTISNLLFYIQKKAINHITGFPIEASKDMTKPLALRGFARWFSQSQETFRESDLTPKEVKVLKALILNRIKRMIEKESSKDLIKNILLNGGEIYFRYSDYNDFPLTAPPAESPTTNPIWQKENQTKGVFYENTDESIVLNISKFLGQFKINIESNDDLSKLTIDATIDDSYDFNIKVDKVIEQPEITSDEIHTAYFVFGINYLFYNLVKNEYGAARKSAGVTQKLSGLKPYKIEINLNDINDQDTITYLDGLYKNKNIKKNK